MLEKPGRKPKSATASSTANARAWEPTAKSTIVLRLRTEARWCASFSAVITMSLVRSGAASHRPTGLTRPDPFTPAQAHLDAIAGVAGLLQPHHDAVLAPQASVSSRPLIPPFGSRGWCVPSQIPNNCAAYLAPTPSAAAGDPGARDEDRNSRPLHPSSDPFRRKTRPVPYRDFGDRSRCSGR